MSDVFRGRVLVLEDDGGVNYLQCQALKRSGFTAVPSMSATDALEKIREGGIDILLTDYVLPGELNGVDFYKQVVAAGFDLPAILVTGFSDEQKVIEALRAGVREFIPKTLDYIEFLPAAVERVMKQVRAERQLAESERLRESEERFRTSVESLLDAFATFTASRDSSGEIVDLRIEFANHAACASLGRCAEELNGRGLLQLLPSSRTNGLFAHYVQVVVTGEPFVADGCQVTDDWGDGRRTRSFDIRVSKLGDGIAAAWRDVTDRMLAEEALRESQERLRLAVDSAALGAWELAPQTGALFFSERCRKMFGFGPDEQVTYQIFLGRLHPEDRIATEAAVDAALNPTGNGHYSIDYRAVWPDGTVRWIAAAGRAFFDGEGSNRVATRFLGTVLDVSQRKLAELELNRAKQAAEAANQAKDQFLAALSHELRTPLTPVLAIASDLERDAALPRELREKLRVISRNVELEARLIDDLLDLTRIVRGKLELRRDVVVLDEVLRQTSHDVCPPADKDVALDLQLTLQDARTWADASRLTQVICNLLSNAYKFTGASGRVTLSSSLEPGGGLAFEVRDNGMGIDPEMLPRIFDAFEQGPRRITRQFGGLGLGLAISKAIVDRHGGTLTAESDGLGKGAKFRVVLPPLKDSQNVGAQSHFADDSAGANKMVPWHILVVEDHADTASVMENLLRRMKHKVTIANSIAEAMAMEEKNRESAPFDLILCDLGLPDGSGIDLMRQLSQRSSARAIALSGFGMDEDVLSSRAAGFSAHLVKPVSLSTLEATMKSVMLSGR